MPADIQADVQQTVEARPDIVRTISLPHKSVLGRDVPALEISHHVRDNDGRPVFLLMGGIHANEWPGVEVATEFAMDLAEQDGRDPRITALLDRVRVIILPVVNPDGYEVSRGGRIPDKRKNCDPTCGTAVDPDTGSDSAGVDLNRNFGVNWGGVGSGGDKADGDYRGPKPFSEPETQNIRDLVTGRQVTVLVGLHTYGDMNLRPPGQNASPLTPDEAVYAELGDQMAQANGYPSKLSRDLYETSGTAEEWSYHTTGGLGFETELAGETNHGPFTTSVLDQYHGEREALLRDAEAAGNPRYHSRITGTAHGTLELSKPGLHSTMTADGPFTWDVNPSIRPGTDGRNIQESWTLTCSGRTVPVTVGRGETTTVSC
ncbi:M14 family zinc carboxypeptidase [Kutzneria kofuensis]|uniref:Peptidase M14 domain-containing protein n=1 Tax=Kutzneria kofuensis TaxID=103725 RepID=A0A7W9NMJ8_9PSEU|nr:M14 family zinc carboxypeptidase [Kutzneria kofuensis]MBB5897428.1 hypothetical protein [Kutzneria kofuensis]